MIDLENLNINLTQEERATLEGSQGPTMQKVLETVVLYGEALGAEKLVDIEGDGHFVIPWCTPGIAPSLEMLDELAEAGLKTKYPFTLDPHAPIDFENLGLSKDVEEKIEEMYQDQSRYDERMMQLGLRDSEAYTCNPYQPEVGNIPRIGTIVAWSESSCAVFANSVLGARTDRNGAIMDLLVNIVGKTPLVDVLTDEGRHASWLIEVKTELLPNPQLLGAAIGARVVADVPYIVGLDHFLRTELNPETLDYLQEMGAACATYGAVGLYHVENITPEAVEQGRDLLLPGHSSHIVDDKELQELFDSYPILWSESEVIPEKCFIGCPHLSMNRLTWWANKIDKALQLRGKDRLAIETVIFTSPQLLQKFKADEKRYSRLMKAGVKLSASCSETIYETGLYSGKPVLTNSNKLRAYTSARFFPDQELLEILVTGEVTRDS